MVREDSNSDLTVGRDASGGSDEVAIANADVAMQSQSVQLLTVHSFGNRYKINIGGYVTAHAVKLLSGKRTGVKWDNWWRDVRDEVCKISSTTLALSKFPCSETLL